MTRQKDLIYAEQQYKQFYLLSNKMIEKGVQNNDNRIKLGAILAAGDKKLPIREAYLEALVSPDAMVRQAARRSLVILSAVKLNSDKEYDALAKKCKLKFVDFGPPPCCKREEAEASKELWEAWFDEVSPSLKTIQKK